jgi:cephalosporin hydroxylase
MSTMNNLEILQKLCAQFQPKRTLEVGLAFGGSAILFTAFHRRTGAPATGQHTAVDPFQTEVWDEVGLVAIEDAGLRDYLDFRPILSSLALPRLVAEKAQFDLIYVDGSHLFEDVFIDFYYSTRLLSDGGIIAFDDSSDPHVRKVLRFIKADFQFALDPIDLGPYRADKGASLRYRVARALGRVQLTAFRKIGPAARAWNSPMGRF